MTMKFETGMDSGMTCKQCGGQMLVRTNSKSEHQFLGCANYPGCKGTQQIPQEMLLRSMGVPYMFKDDPKEKLMEKHECPECKGTGEIVAPYVDEHDGENLWWHTSIRCERCDGEGVIG